MKFITFHYYITFICIKIKEKWGRVFFIGGRGGGLPSQKIDINLPRTCKKLNWAHMKETSTEIVE